MFKFKNTNIFSIVCILQKYYIIKKFLLQYGKIKKRKYFDKSY